MCIVSVCCHGILKYTLLVFFLKRKDLFIRSTQTASLGEELMQANFAGLQGYESLTLEAKL